MTKKVLILGGGVAGSASAYFLRKKGYEVTLVEALGKAGIGGRSRTYHYSGHPYEFGPHVWFWPGGEDNEINKVIVDLSDDDLLYIDRKLFTYIEKDQRAYRYPVHYNEIDQMPEAGEIHQELSKNRDENNKLIEANLPTLGKCTFEEYFTAAIGNTLYSKFMENYTWKMWNIPGDELQTSMVWADRFNHAYSKNKDGKTGLEGYDPLKFEDHTLGKGIRFQVYPRKGWAPIWDRMVEGVEIIQDKVIKVEESGSESIMKMESGQDLNFSDYDTVISTISIDELFGEDTLPYTGRMMIPLVIPGVGHAFPDGAESLHYSSAEFHTRVTEMKTITQHESDDSLILIEVPILPGSESSFPTNTIAYAKKNNLYSAKAYPQQSKDALELHQSYVDRAKAIPNLRLCGRLAQFRYWGMPETVNAAHELSKQL